MSIESELYDRLSGNAGLAAKIGTRIYPGALPQDATFPAISYFRVSSVRTHKFGASSPVVMARYQLDCWAQQYRNAGGTGARDIFDLLRAALDRWSNASGTVVQDTLLETDRDEFEDEPDPGLYRVMLEAVIYYEES